MVLRSLGRATRGAVQIATLLVGKLLLAGLKAYVVVSMDQARPGRRAPFSVRAGLRERVAHRRQLIGHRPGGGFVHLDVREVEPRDLEELRRDGAARRGGVACAAVAGDKEQQADRGADHLPVVGSALVRVKAV
jgi:hypothetical protein